MDNNQRKVISRILINSSKNDKLDNGVAKQVALSCSVSIDVIYRIWKQLKLTSDVCHLKAKICSRKRIEIDFEKVRDVSLPKWRTLRGLAYPSGVVKSKTTLTKYLREGVLRRHSNALKPQLKDNNKKARLKFCLSMLEESSISHDPVFKSMHNVVHIDEKWFYMSPKSSKFYLLATEDDPYCTCKNKNYIGKVMFLVAVARPRFDDEGNGKFNGKISMFPLVIEIAAKRSSANEASGTLETKPITSITKEVSRMFLINKVLPAVKEKWPREDVGETIYIQQANAQSHISIDDEKFCRVAIEDGFDVHLTCQPPNSPDLNILDLGFFSAIQSLWQKEVSMTVDDLIEVVQKSYEALSSKDSNKNFLTL